MTLRYERVLQACWPSRIFVKPARIATFCIGFGRSFPTILPRLHDAGFKPKPFISHVYVARSNHVFALEVQWNVACRAPLCSSIDESASTAWAMINRRGFGWH